MRQIDDRLSALLDRDNIRECLVRLARGEDRRDAQMITECFWPDATADFGIFKGNLDEYLDWVVPGSPQIPVTLHTLGQSFIQLDGNSARVETHVTSYHRVDMGEEHRDIVFGGRYLDHLQSRDGQWRIAERVLVYDWFQDDGVSVDWSQGVMGMPFSGEHYTGRAVGDFSETFFSKHKR